MTDTSLEFNHATLGMTYNNMYLVIIEKNLSFSSTHPTTNNPEKIVFCVKSRYFFFPPAKEQ